MSLIRESRLCNLLLNPISPQQKANAQRQQYNTQNTGLNPQQVGDAAMLSQQQQSTVAPQREAGQYNPNAVNPTSPLTAQGPNGNTYQTSPQNLSQSYNQVPGDLQAAQNAASQASQNAQNSAQNQGVSDPAQLSQIGANAAQEAMDKIQTAQISQNAQQQGSTTGLPQTPPPGNLPAGSTLTSGINGSTEGGSQPETAAFTQQQTNPATGATTPTTSQQAGSTPGTFVDNSTPTNQQQPTFQQTPQTSGTSGGTQNNPPPQTGSNQNTQTGQNTGTDQSGNPIQQTPSPDTPPPGVDQTVWAQYRSLYNTYDPMIMKAHQPAFDQINDILSQFQGINGGDITTSPNYLAGMANIYGDQANFAAQENQLELGQYGTAIKMQTAADLNKDLAINVADLNKAVLQTKANQAAIQNTIQYNQQTRDNMITEIQTRNAASRLGVGMGTGGVQMINNALQKGQDQLNLILANGQAISQQYALQETQGYQNAIEQASADYMDQSGKIWSDLQTGLDRIQQERTTDASSRRGQATTLFDSTVAQHNNLIKTLSTAYNSAASEVSSGISAGMRMQFDKQQGVMANIASLYTSGGGALTPALNAEIQAGVDAGIPWDRLSGYASGTLTMQGTINQYQMKAMQYSQPNYFKDPQQDSVMQLMKGVNFNGDQTKQADAYYDIGSLLEQGKTEMARNKVIGYAVAQMPTTERAQVTSGQNLLSQISDLDNFLSENAQHLKDTGIYMKTYQDSLTYAQSSKDPILQEFYARASLITADQLHQLYGARLTKTEIGFADDFAPQATATLGTTVTGLGILKKHISSLLNDDIDTGLSLSSPLNLTSGNGDTGPKIDVGQPPDPNDPASRYKNFYPSTSSSSSSSFSPLRASEFS